MKKVKDLVPKTKFDFSGIEELRKLSDEEIITAGTVGMRLENLDYSISFAVVG